MAQDPLNFDADPDPNPDMDPGHEHFCNIYGFSEQKKVLDLFILDEPFRDFGFDSKIFLFAFFC